MITSASNRAFAGTITPAVVLLSLSSLAFTDTWSSIADADFTGNQYRGAKLAAAEVMFLKGGSMQEDSTLLIAITDGLDGVRLYSFNTVDSTITFEDEVNVEVDSIADPVAWSPTFMDLDVAGDGEESCLVIPTMSDGTDGGSISIVRLTERNQSDELLVIDNCFKCDDDDHGDVYYVAELPPSAEQDYAISTEFSNPLQNVILLASFDSDSSRFDDESTFNVPYLYYGARHEPSEARAWVTYVQRFRYGSEFDGPLCYTTNHNGGVLIWDPVTNSNDRTISRIAVSQYGGWEYDSLVHGELGDVHRAAILEGGSSTFSDLDTIQVDCRLLFFSNRTMGFIVSDVSKPDAPQHVWQWDCDTRPCEGTGIDPDWDWHGSGNVDDDAISKADGGSFPGETFGIGVASNSSDDPPTIHVYLAGGVDGLRLFDLSEFLDPFGEDTTGDSNFDDFSIDSYDSYEVDDFEMQAFDLQTFTEGDDTYVFTSWRKNRTNISGPIGLTVHVDEDVVSD